VEFIGQKHPSFGEEATSKLNLTAPGWASVAAWLDSVPSEKTQRNYEMMFGIFWKYATEVHFRGLIDSPDALVSHRFKEVKLGDEDPASFHCESIVEAFHKKLKADGLADRSAQGYVATVRSFFNHATRDKASLKLRINYRHKRVRIKYVPTQEDLVKLRRFCSPRTWTWIVAMKDSGFGPDQLSHIRWGQIDKVNTGDPSYWFMYGQREKTDEPFATFFGPDSTAAITATYGTGQGKGLDAPIFLGEYGEPISSKGISMAIKRAVIAAGFTSDERTKNFTAYSLRAFYNTQLETARVPDNWRKRAMGHAVGMVQGAYSGPHIETLVETYKAAYKYLRVEGMNTERGVSAEQLGELLSILTPILKPKESGEGIDLGRIASFVKKYGEDDPLSKLAKEQLDKLLKQQISASEAAAR